MTMFSSIFDISIQSNVSCPFLINFKQSTPWNKLYDLSLSVSRDQRLHSMKRVLVYLWLVTNQIYMWPLLKVAVYFLFGGIISGHWLLNLKIYWIRLWTWRALLSTPPTIIDLVGCLRQNIKWTDTVRPFWKGIGMDWVCAAQCSTFESVVAN